MGGGGRWKREEMGDYSPGRRGKGVWELAGLFD